MQITSPEIITQKINLAQKQINNYEIPLQLLQKSSHMAIALIEKAESAIEYNSFDINKKQRKLHQALELITKFKMPLVFMQRMASIRAADLKEDILERVKILQYYLDTINIHVTKLHEHIDNLNDEIRGYKVLLQNQARQNILAQAHKSYDLYNKVYLKRADYLEQGEYYEKTGQFLEAEVYYAAAAAHNTESPKPEAELLRKTFADPDSLSPPHQIVRLWNLHNNAINNVKTLKSRTNSMRHFCKEIRPDL